MKSQLADDEVMHGSPLFRIRGCWVHPTHISELNVANMRGHIFALSDSGEFQAYEYRQGTLPSIIHDDDEFLLAFKAYLTAHDLEGLVGLQILTDENDDHLQEFILSQDNGTIILSSKDTNITKSYRITGFVVEVGKAGHIGFRGNKSHALAKRQTHQVSTDGQSLPDEGSLISALRLGGIID